MEDSISRLCKHKRPLHRDLVFARTEKLSPDDHMKRAETLACSPGCDSLGRLVDDNKVPQVYQP